MNNPNLIRTYYVPLPAYSYNSVYYIPKYKKRLSLKPFYYDYKKFCYNIYLRTDAYYDNIELSRSDKLFTDPRKVSNPNFKIWIDSNSLYNIYTYFGFPSKSILTRKNDPKRAKDVDGLFKLTLDSLFEYAGIGDQYVKVIEGTKLITDEDNNHLHSFKFTTRKELDTSNSFFAFKVVKKPKLFNSTRNSTKLKNALEGCPWKKILKDLNDENA